MSRVRNRNTVPEVRVRSLLHRMGYRFRLHRQGLPGSPDIVFPRHKKVIFVHGCFWHGHPDCKRSKRPTTNTEFWTTKIDRNIARDIAVQNDLAVIGWSYLIVWQCETLDVEQLDARLRLFLAPE